MSHLNSATLDLKQYIEAEDGVCVSGSLCHYHAQTSAPINQIKYRVLSNYGIKKTQDSLQKSSESCPVITASTATAAAKTTQATTTSAATTSPPFLDNYEALPPSTTFKPSPLDYILKKWDNNETSAPIPKSSVCTNRVLDLYSRRPARRVLKISDSSIMYSIITHKGDNLLGGFNNIKSKPLIIFIL